MLFTYLHLAPDPEQTDDLLASGVIAIAYETVTSPQGTLPLLTPMSEVAGRMAPHVGARCLEKENGGRGVLLGGVPGVPPADVVIIGGGVAGSHAALISAPAWARPSRWSTAIRRRCAGSPASSASQRAHRVLDPRRDRDRCAAAPTSSSARCCCRAPPRRS